MKRLGSTFSNTTNDGLTLAFLIISDLVTPAKDFAVRSIPTEPEVDFATQSEGMAYTDPVDRMITSDQELARQRHTFCAGRNLVEFP
jgi:hypothetical protein